MRLLPDYSRSEIPDEVPSSDSDLKTLHERLAAASRRGRLSHAYLLVGPTNKLDLALFMAQTQCCKRDESFPCGTCLPCRRVLSYSHLDVMVLFWEQVRAQINQVREIQAEASLAPREGRRRVYVIVDAHLMNQESANCLLKILEESPEHAMFILLATNVFSLMPTIVSRCQKIYVPARNKEFSIGFEWSNDMKIIAEALVEERREVIESLREQWPIGLGKLEGIAGSARERRIEKQQKIFGGLFSSMGRQNVFTLVCWAEKLSVLLAEHGKFTYALRDWEAVNEELQREDRKVEELIVAISRRAIEKKDKKRTQKKSKSKKTVGKSGAGICQRREVEELLRFSGRVVDEMVSAGALPHDRLRAWVDFFTETREWVFMNLDPTILLETAFFRLSRIFSGIAIVHSDVKLAEL
ncbi:MAG: hypothetical protein QGH40_15430 [bacterium]|nr:hypothetical protein [bacterium]